MKTFIKRRYRLVVVDVVIKFVIYQSSPNLVFTTALFCPQAELDRTILLNFIQLRSDYKSGKLANCLKGLS